MADSKTIDQSEIENLKETLKRCPEGTLEALLRYRSEGDLDALKTFLFGCIRRHTDEEYHAALDSGNEKISFIDDLGLDSMTIMEIVMMVEECLEIRFDNDKLMQMETLSDLNKYIKKLG
jgi:3-hydroxyacyl-[acyl-carrier-protein] dehydratase